MRVTPHPGIHDRQNAPSVRYSRRQLARHGVTPHQGDVTAQWRATSRQIANERKTRALAAGHKQSVAARPAASRHVLCGSQLWAKKTLSDPQRRLVKLRPRLTTVAAINRLRAPA